MCASGAHAEAREDAPDLRKARAILRQGTDESPDLTSAGAIFGHGAPRAAPRDGEGTILSQVTQREPRGEEAKGYSPDHKERRRERWEGVRTHPPPRPV